MPLFKRLLLPDQTQSKINIFENMYIISSNELYFNQYLKSMCFYEERINEKFKCNQIIFKFPGDYVIVSHEQFQLYVNYRVS